MEMANGNKAGFKGRSLYYKVLYQIVNTTSVFP